MQKAILDCIEIKIIGQLIQEQEQVLLNMIINQSFNVIYDDEY